MLSVDSIAQIDAVYAVHALDLVQSRGTLIAIEIYLHQLAFFLALARLNAVLHCGNCWTWRFRFKSMGG